MVPANQQSVGLDMLGQSGSRTPLVMILPKEREGKRYPLRLSCCLKRLIDLPVEKY